MGSCRLKIIKQDHPFLGKRVVTVGCDKCNTWTFVPVITFDKSTYVCRDCGMSFKFSKPENKDAKIGQVIWSSI